MSRIQSKHFIGMFLDIRGFHDAVVCGAPPGGKGHLKVSANAEGLLQKTELNCTGDGSETVA